jgi:AcrR family transcriptional regulator
VRHSNRRESILASSAPIFNRQGYAGTSIADILDATSLEKGGLYNHFASKEELAVATFDYAFAQVDAYFTKALTGVESGLTKLRTYVDAFERYIERPVVAGGCPIANATLEADDSLPFLRDRVQTAFHRLRDMVVHNLVRAAEKGQFARAIDPEFGADFIVSVLEGALVLSRGMRSRTHARRAAAMLRRWLDDHATEECK